MKKCRLICVFILLSVNLTSCGNNFEIYNAWESIMSTLFSKTNEKGSNEDFSFKSINQYWLYTRDNPSKGNQVIMNDEESILSSNMRKTKETLFVIHGYFGYFTDDLNVNITSAALLNKDVNVIRVDWSAYSKALYTNSVKCVPKVGTDIGDFINWLAKLGYSYDKMHIAGHSLGAHAAGYAGRRANGKIKRITGMDPAGPFWYTMLSPNDAQYVECIHTCAKLFGTDQLCGHADFFPNGGVTMPGCGFDMICGHFKAFYYFAASLEFPEGLVGSKCDSVEDTTNCNCNGEPAPMGNNDLDKKAFGIYCLKTKKDYPYF